MQPLPRRKLLKILATAPAAGVPLLAACSTSPPDAAGSGAAHATTDAALAAATMGLISSTVCRVLPETTEGPYYLDPGLVRRDITEDRPGIPLQLRLQVVTADCRPVQGARVDVWQCDARGNYSGFAAMGAGGDGDTRNQRFLRGTQPTDAHGIATFDTIYPGWYRGRTAHIHYKVFLDNRTVLTSQIFLPDALSEYVYLQAADYRRDEVRDTLNSIDDIATQAGPGAHAAIREQPGRYIAALVVGIDPDADWKEAGQGMAGGMPPGAPPNRGQRPPGPPPGAGGRPPGSLPSGEGGPHGRRTAETRIFPEAQPDEP